MAHASLENLNPGTSVCISFEIQLCSGVLFVYLTACVQVPNVSHDRRRGTTVMVLQPSGRHTRGLLVPAAASLCSRCHSYSTTVPLHAALSRAPAATSVEQYAYEHYHTASDVPPREG